MINVAESVYKSWVIVDHSQDGGRSGEGSLAVLTNGDLLLFYTDFIDGSADHSKAKIVSISSSDAGKTWSSPHTVFEAPAGALNAMAVSLLRLVDGRLGCIYCIKYSKQRLIPFWSYSKDDGKTWSKPQPVTDEEGYFCINNDRLVQLSNGTLVIPYALHTGIGGDEQYEFWDPAWNAQCGLFYSMDGGSTWIRSPHIITHTPEVFRQPLFCDTSSQSESVQYQFKHRLGVFQEPGIEEMSDGSLILYMRSNYAIYRCFSPGVSDPWQGCDVIEGFNVCMGPQIIRRLPDSNRLVMLYNDRGCRSFGEREFYFRTPLSIAVSDDHGKSWQRHGQLEGESRNYCYASLLFREKQFLTTYYESANSIDASGREIRRNLASLKFGIGENDRFKS